MKTQIKRFNGTLLGILLIFGGLLGVLQAAPNADNRWYEIELVVFENKGFKRNPTESWIADPGTPSRDKAIFLVDQKTYQSMGGNPDNLYVALDSNSLRLKDSQQKLFQSKHYEPLIHVAWRQPIVARNASKAVYLRSAASVSGTLGKNLSQNNEPIPKVEGSIRASLSRYLHVEFDLVFADPNPNYDPNAVPALNAGDTTTTMGNVSTPGGFQPLSPTAASLKTSPKGVDMRTLPVIKYRLVTLRRMKSKELHYIDHPRFGALIVITPLKADKNAP